MSNGFNNFFDGDLLEHINRFVGETVTIFTTSGGQSGSGFTGVVLGVNSCFVRLLTEIGPAPSCALGNDCCGWNRRRRCCNSGCNGRRFGSVVDIPIDRIAAFVHNTV